MMSAKILLVDDDPHVLRGYQRRLYDQFEIETAPGGSEGLTAIETGGPFAVVVADMRMPVMDGIQFLARVREIAPDTVRMMLTGNADMQTAIDAVNQGNIFRFLTKPCPTDVFIEALRAGVKQYLLVTSERELLEETLNGSVKVLIDVLSLASPTAFTRANRATRIVGRIANKLQLPNVWQFKLAAMLSQLGCITLPAGVLDKINTQTPLSDAEQHMFDVHPSVGHQLLVRIPRLKLIARMIEQQQNPPANPVSPKNLAFEEDVVLMGAQLLKVALDFDQHVSRGLSHHDALALMHAQPGTYNPILLAALDGGNAQEISRESGGAQEQLIITVAELKTGMVIEQDVWSKNGIMLVQKGQEVTLPVLMRLRNFAQGIGIEEPFLVKTQS